MCCLCVGAACLTCCIEWALVHMMHFLLHKTDGLRHVVRRSHRRACVTSGLLQETKSIVRTHHIPADSSQTPGGKKSHSWRKRCISSSSSFSRTDKLWHYYWLKNQLKSILLRRYVGYFKRKPMRLTHSSLEYLYASSTIFLASSKDRWRKGLPRYSSADKEN